MALRKNNNQIEKLRVLQGLLRLSQDALDRRLQGDNAAAARLALRLPVDLSPYSGGFATGCVLFDEGRDLSRPLIYTMLFQKKGQEIPIATFIYRLSGDGAELAASAGEFNIDPQDARYFTDYVPQELSKELLAN